MLDDVQYVNGIATKHVVGEGGQSKALAKGQPRRFKQAKHTATVSCLCAASNCLAEGCVHCGVRVENPHESKHSDCEFRDLQQRQQHIKQQV